MVLPSKVKEGKERGADFSKWNVFSSYEEAARHLNYAILRIGYGSSLSQKDKLFDVHYRGLTSNGIPVGAYQYSYARTVEGARKEAEVCIQWLKGYDLDLPVMYDMEDETQQNLGIKTLTAMALVWMEVMRAAGYRVGIYSNKYWFTSKLDYEKLREEGYIWYAQYNKENNFGKDVDIWQYSSKGQVPGVKGNVDMNHAYKDLVWRDGLLKDPQEIEVEGKPLFPGESIRVGTEVVVSSYYKSSLSAIEEAIIPKVWKTGRVSKIKESARNPYLIEIHGVVLGWCNRGDIRKVSVDKENNGSAEEMILLEMSKIGTSEPHGDDEFIAWYGGFALDVPWCAIFQSWAAYHAGISTNIIPKFANCDVGLKWFEDRGLFHYTDAYGGEGYHPKRGDLIFFTSVYKKYDSTHVGMVTGVDLSRVYTVEGNSKDSVRENSYLRTNKYILGYATPEYEDKAIELPHTEYRVMRGDTLSSIAKRNHTTYQALAKYNNIVNPNKISVGDIIKIPVLGG